MQKANITDYKLVSKLSVRKSDDGAEYTYVCRINGEKTKVKIKESGEDASTATLVKSTMMDDED